MWACGEGRGRAEGSGGAQGAGGCPTSPSPLPAVDGIDDPWDRALRPPQSPGWRLKRAEQRLRGAERQGMPWQSSARSHKLTPVSTTRFASLHRCRAPKPPRPQLRSLPHLFPTCSSSRDISQLPAWRYYGAVGVLPAGALSLAPQGSAPARRAPHPAPLPFVQVRPGLSPAPSVPSRALGGDGDARAEPSRCRCHQPQNHWRAGRKERAHPRKVSGKFWGVLFFNNPEPKALNVLKEHRGEPSAIPWPRSWGCGDTGTKNWGELDPWVPRVPPSSRRLLVTP